jgi:hypothetical protein
VQSYHDEYRWPGNSTTLAVCNELRQLQEDVVNLTRERDELLSQLTAVTTERNAMREPRSMSDRSTSAYVLRNRANGHRIGVILRTDSNVMIDPDKRTAHLDKGEVALKWSLDQYVLEACTIDEGTE